MQRFEHVGVIEGYYGPKWSHADRLYVIERIGAWGMNRYYYAPKDDALHRARWREPYPKRDLDEFRELVDRGERAGVDVGFALSPGLSIRYASADDRRALLDKFRGFVDLGARRLCLALDDVPTRLQHEEDQEAFDSLGDAHAALAVEIAQALGADVGLYVVPTDYLGVGSSPYLETLGAALPPEIEIGWTGRTVVSPTIESREAQARSAALERRVLIWDNVPVTDGPMRAMLHMGPYAGRAADLPEYASGILLNPMEHAHASCVALYTASRYAADPAGYDPETAWNEAIEEVGDGEPEAFRLFVEAHRFSPLHTEDRDRGLEARFAEIANALEDGRDFSDLLLEVRELAQRRVQVAESLRAGLTDRRLAAEIDPWLESHETESRRILVSIEALLEILADAPQNERLFAFMRMQGRLSLEPDNGRVSYGPRRVLYPQLTSMVEDEMRLSVEPTLIRDHCLADEILEFVEDLAMFALSDPDA
ncbi:MAG: beta-N-acetylglucosaminidase domain-containing protein [Deltaproteobacteria bacterium]|nr:beta-N-acetylglucosaminidase domain-containing protein [Deltaproteobacteria bacterium]MBW2415375.1 beta-N-acetylglucosaminidase domain-containing protein [Deltaproteobacteria bacterium]